MAKKRLKRKPLTQTQLNYNKQRKRIQNFLYKAQKRGYIFTENILPEKPKRITKASVARLEKLTPTEIYKKARYAGAETYGEIVPASEGLKLEKQARARKAAETRKAKKNKQKKQSQQKKQYPKPEQPKTKRKKRTSNDSSFYTRAVIGSFLATLDSCKGGKAYPILLQWLGKLRYDNGDEAVADMLTKASEHGYSLTWDVIYDAEKAEAFMSGTLDFLTTQCDFYKDDVMQYLHDISAMENAMYEDANFWTYDE